MRPKKIINIQKYHNILEKIKSEHLLELPQNVVFEDDLNRRLGLLDSEKHHRPETSHIHGDRNVVSNVNPT